MTQTMPTATKRRARLGDLLVARGVITAAELTRALEVQQAGQQDRLIGEILVDLNYASREQVLSAVAEACNVPFVRLTPQLVDPAARTALPPDFLQKHCVLPLFRVREVLTVAVPEPSNMFLIDEISHAAGMSVQVVAATAENIYALMDETRPADAQGPDLAAGLDEIPPPRGDLLVPDDYDSVYGTWPPEKVVGLLIREAVRSRASAIHLEPDEKVLRIRFRIDGVLHVVMRPPVRLAAGLANAFDEMLGFSGKTASAHEVRRSARLLVQGRAVQIHVSSLNTVFGPRAVARLVRDQEAQRPLEKLGCDFHLLETYRHRLADVQGLVIVSGPRESGITTTLYSTLGALDPVRLNVCTFESSVHFSLPGVNQFSPATCGIGDRAALISRLMLQQPDVLMLDGVLDDQVLPVALDASFEGCLVLAQARGRDAAETIAMLAERVPVRRLGSALRVVVAQRLVRTVCPSCRSTHEPQASLRRRVAEALGPVEEYVKGRGCAACGHTGFLGQIGLFEVIPMDRGLVDLVVSGAGADALRAALRGAGHPSLWTDGLNKVRAGITSIDEVLEVLSGCPGGLEAAPAADHHPPVSSAGESRGA